MAIADDRQRLMPKTRDRNMGKTLDYKEAVLLTNPSNPILKGEVDDKYQYSKDSKDNRVHGWVSTNKNIGFWVILASDESRAGGPLKQELTSHAGSTSLAVFVSRHYNGPPFGVSLGHGEPWKKVFGPVYVYLNSGSRDDDPRSLWDDAKRQLSEETEKWPYNFPLSKDYPRAEERGAISGRLLVHDNYTDKEIIPAKSAYIGLAPPGNAGSWQDETKGYQFWNRTDENGYFTIRGVRVGTYNLYAWVPTILGDYKYDSDINIKPGSEVVQIGNLVYKPPRSGPTLWEIGVPDRTASEFYVPDPDPGFVNKLYVNHTQKFRQYGLWARYAEIYQHQDPIYTVRSSNFTKDWFFAHVNRKTAFNTFETTTRRIKFDANNISRTGTYMLRLALASAQLAEIQVWIDSNYYGQQPHFSTGLIGRDNAIARHGIHGKQWFYSVNISGSQLVNGNNTIYLRQSRTTGPFTGVMYDYIRFEGPPRA